jgi:hypothetical protein
MRRSARYSSPLAAPILAAASPSAPVDGIAEKVINGCSTAISDASASESRDFVTPEKAPTNARREYLRNYQRQWMADRRTAWFANKSCGKCGSTHELHIHHRDPAEKVSNRVWSWSEPRRLAELAKCEVLCRSCHEEHHAAQLRRHGTVSRYRKGCRCDLCKRAKAIATAGERARRKIREATPTEVAA